MSKRLNVLIYIFLFIGGVGFYSAFAAYERTFSVSDFSEYMAEQVARQIIADSDSDSVKTVKSRFPVTKTSPETYDDLLKKSPADLKTPENVQTVVEYDPQTNSYVIHSKVGDYDIMTPFMLSADEYKDYSLQKSMQAYYQQKNAESFAKRKEGFNFLDMKFNIGPLDKVFGPGGVQIKTQGSAEITMSIKTNKIDNPALAIRARKKTYFDFDEKIQANVTAKVGDKLNFGMNYNTDATFDFDQQKLKLQYEGKEDEIIKNIEAGNVSMTTGSSLIRGSAALFGVKATLQFGKLTATALVSQQESESKTVNSSGGGQMTDFEFSADQYDENRHFFLAQYFRDNYDNFISKLPYISSGITINRIEVWVTNKQSNFDQSRNIVAFMDLAESDKLAYPGWGNGGSKIPSNNSNRLYSVIKSIEGARNINLVTQALEENLPPQVVGGQDYVKIENARKLESSEYVLNSQLGYISLKSRLNSDEVLAVAFEYTKNGQHYQVGEFSGNITNTDECLFLKMLKGTTITTNLPIWKLMMKNVYSLNAMQIQKEKFRLDIYYKSDTAGVSLTYLPVGDIKNQTLLKVMNLDRLDNNNEVNPNGFFDFVDGYTIIPSMGRVIFPVVEPFGSHLKKKIGNYPDVDKYIYQELYDSTLTAARQFADKNKFVMKGEFRSSSGAEIRLNAMNVPRGSVRVTAGGMTLTENVDYSVDYSMGVVTILNQSYIDSGTPISVSLESQTFMNMQRKTMVGLDLSYKFSKNFTLGGTIMHLGEKSLTEKVNLGNEVLNNTLWGLNTSYTTEFQWLTSLVNKIPTVNATAPSRLAINAEFAQLIPGKAKNKAQSYIDDFEASQLGLDIRTPYSWVIASTPSMFPESKLSNNYEYGKNRSLISWYYIDRLFTQRNSSLVPAHIKNDLDQLSNHYIREVDVSEIFPNKELGYGESNTLQVLNLSYYPQERGPYNMDVNQVGPDGNFLDPENRWGGIMRKMDTPDFEAANIEYLQFWMLDPFLYNDQDYNEGGYLYFNFGEISEDILKDGMKSFENGLPIDGDTTQLSSTVWGRVSKRQSMVYAFDNSKGAREKQDVGLDGLSNDEEFSYYSYANFLKQLRPKLSQETISRMEQDQFSPINDPAGDNYHFFRGVDYDNAQMNILERYKHYNGLEGNSTSPDDAADKYYQSSKSVPDVEDINQDNTLNEYERYYQYKVRIRPEDLKVGYNYITDKRTTTVHLRNGKNEEVTWYQFKIPLKDDSDDKTHEPREKFGSIQDFRTIRFARMFMTGFKKPTHLRFATMELVRGEWRSYTLSLKNDNGGNTNLPAEGDLEVSVVNIEENAGQTPVNYVLPPGITRVIDPGQSQITQLNEQAMSLKITSLPSKAARAVYKNTGIDMRNYKRLQMFTHAEKLIDDKTSLKNGEMSVFLRIGSDQRNNYYEYEIPLDLTPEGYYNTYNAQDQNTVWPSQNMFDFPLTLLTDLKLKRNAAKRKGMSSVSNLKPYSEYDPDKPKNKVTIMGNPSLSDISTILIGVRNNAATEKDIVVWVNELRMSGFNEDGGWAARANMNLSISDLATVNVGGHVETVGFGGLDQSLSERRLDNYYQYNVATMVDVGRFLPEKAKIKAPLFYSVSEERTTPKYNPLDQDILLKDALDNAQSKSEKDSISEFSTDRSKVESFSISGFKVDIQSKNPMPYDPANFSLSYSSNKQSKKNPTTLFENTYDRRGNFSYTYTPYVKPFTPFAFIKSNSKHLKLFKDFGLNYLPTNISFTTNISRYYYEQQLRSIDEGFLDMPISVNKNFLWDRQFSLQWNLTKSLNLSLSTMTNARIDEPAGVVNKKLFPDEYRAWKDTVMQSILHLGRPWNYNQNFTASFDLPLNKIPVLDWMNLGAKFNSNYTWDRGVYVDAETELGNNIANRGELSFDGRMNLESLYNKSTFLKNVNKKFSGSRRPSPAKPRPKSFNRRITLKSDTTVTLRHNLDNKRLKVSAKTRDGKLYPIRYKVIDANSIMVLNKDSAGSQVTVSVIPGKRIDESFWYKAAEYSSRFVMMTRNVSVRYRRANAMNVPSFRPNVGDIFGQSNSYSALAPGLDFAFGITDENYIRKISEKGWLIQNDSLVSPAIINRTDELQIDATLEPIKGLKITLNANRTSNKNNQIQFMYDGMPVIRGGNFTMTHVAIRTSLRGAKASNGYQSKAFDQFLRNREIIAARLENRYAGSRYPKAGFIAGETNLGGNVYNPDQNGGVNKNSPDVMIPAFIAAYSGRDAKKVGLTAFPSLRSLLPNWRITYDGLGKMKSMSKYFKAITLSHAYRCTYTVGSYTSYLNWVGLNEEMGFVKDELSGNPIPSSPFDISSVSIVESFAPLLGVDVTMKNNVTLGAEYKDSRTLSLNSAAGQIVESMTRDISIRAGYKITNFNAFLKMKNDKDQTFSNDLTLRGEFSFRKNQALIRRIEQNFTQATSGTQSLVLKFSADYALSKLITLRAFYDKQINTPLVSSTSYPTSDSSFGVSIRIDLMR
ncbi:cell surface protein SprA [Coprobacter tertius]|uniref:Cell surface protein SprA n=1 Tax=Coprobacter tertius TaxID=2944915 RepID=A0ABT1MJB7_9BACT|nr:cell surface protein SprA [Coprobacter tertius]MCP9612720.1 cell surface protein SprA [Coprobacter tertius]